MEVTMKLAKTPSFRIDDTVVWQCMRFRVVGCQPKDDSFIYDLKGNDDWMPQYMKKHFYYHIWQEELLSLYMCQPMPHGEPNRLSWVIE
jgi:hypothetical protein